MDKLIQAAKRTLQYPDSLPFSVYSSVKEQRLVNVPVIKPLLICVLDGCKKIGKDDEVSCPAGSFVFLSNSPKVDLRNIAADREYLALLIEFDYQDFASFGYRQHKTANYFHGPIPALLKNTLQQFVEWSAFAPAALWPLRRQEILQTMYHAGYQQVSAVIEPPSLSHKVYSLISADISNDHSVAALSTRLAMSESTLRRKLTAEGVSLQALKDRAKLGYGLHLVQTSLAPVGHIAEQCGYQSQSRFTDKFKQLFGITPTELRRTKMPD
ncbi:helix-turn-helix transcriptional regulator [Rheinheimera oceanensis]|uniref:helix-turn-helix transcriptional regulator n=1 Tax=Rheinheimera oceanensis TaxID=2817449 RepID=UPI001BFEBFED|nr:AraC family transcriptional regulator [Rheinheimera oceanensis]